LQRFIFGKIPPDIENCLFTGLGADMFSDFIQPDNKITVGGKRIFSFQLCFKISPADNTCDFLIKLRRTSLFLSEKFTNLPSKCPFAARF
jgi:hypothetical protein